MLLARRNILSVSMAFLLSRVGTAQTLPGPITSAGQQLAALLDGMDVEALWQHGYHVDWRTGVAHGPEQTTPGGHTHCSAFAAAVAERLGVYLLRPPEHPQMWLANAQERWLSEAPDGWHPLGRVADPGTSPRAVAFANTGKLVLAIYFQPPRITPEGPVTRSGHIAIVRPSSKSPALINQDGPDVIEAATRNYTSVPMRMGFAAHKTAWSDGAIEYFWHETTLQ